MTMTPIKEKLKFKSPDPSPRFKRYWDQFVGDLSKRENFKEGHLSQLAILCDLFVEYETLRDTLEVGGYTYENEGGRNGNQIRQRPEVNQINKTRTMIKDYSKMLGLVPYKDTDVDDSGEEKDAWE